MRLGSRTRSRTVKIAGGLKKRVNVTSLLRPRHPGVECPEFMESDKGFYDLIRHLTGMLAAAVVSIVPAPVGVVLNEEIVNEY